MEDIRIALMAVSLLVFMFSYKFFIWPRLMHYLQENPIESVVGMLGLAGSGVIVYWLVGNDVSNLSQEPEPLLTFLLLFVGYGLMGGVVFFSLLSRLNAKKQSSPTITPKPDKAKPSLPSVITSILEDYDTADAQITNSPERKVQRKKVLQELTQIGHQAVPTLLDVVVDRSGRYSKASLSLALAALEEIDPIALSLHILNHSKKADARRKAAQKLGDLGDKRSIRFLQKLLNDEDAEVRKIAKDSLAFYSAVSDV